MVVGELDQRQRATLDIGSWLIMGTLGVGLQLGRWPAWSVLLATAGYLTWVLAYSEATVQFTRRRRGERSLRLAVSD
jgi:hypothetical protein